MSSRGVVVAALAVGGLVGTGAPPPAHAFMRPGRAEPAGCGARMLRVSGGAFSLAETKVLATVDDFCLDRREVSVDDYRACAARGLCRIDPAQSSAYEACTSAKPELHEHPMNCVTWFEADAFCRSEGKRLPTEAEWEWAARGGPRGFHYAWGDEPLVDVSCSSAGPQKLAAFGNATCPVGRYEPSPLGFHDLTGNVWEWTATARHDDYASWSRKVGEEVYVFRGGSYGTPYTSATVGVRGGDTASWRDPEVGFRCARGGR
jgi:formylglycine-generating enzyme required for sulfatase activity